MSSSQIDDPPAKEEGLGGLFSSSRVRPFPSIFPSHRTPVTWDIFYVGILSSFLMIVIAFMAIFPAFTGTKDKVKVFMRVICGLSLGTIIMACNFGQEWEVGSVRTNTSYKAGTGQTIHALLGVGMSLRSVNITLKALEEPRGDLAGEKIDYNERFSWAWGQGNPGFGPLAGPIQQAFRAAQVKGTPLPILWIAEYFVIDGEGIRWGRHYRHAGWYAHICVWTAFPLWILTLIFFKMVVRFGAQTLALTGSMMLSAALIWALYRNPTELQIPFEGGLLTTHFGMHWYLSLITGVVCLVTGVGIYLLDNLYPGKLNWIFGNNPLSIVEQETGVEEETEEPGELKPRRGLQRAGRRVVTTLRVRGSNTSFKKVTHYAHRESEASIVPYPDDEAEEDTTDSRPSTSAQPLCSASYKAGHVQIHLEPEGATCLVPTGPQDNPSYERGQDEDNTDSPSNYQN